MKYQNQEENYSLVQTIKIKPKPIKNVKKCIKLNINYDIYNEMNVQTLEKLENLDFKFIHNIINSIKFENNIENQEKSIIIKNLFENYILNKKNLNLNLSKIILQDNKSISNLNKIYSLDNFTINLINNDLLKDDLVNKNKKNDYILTSKHNSFNLDQDEHLNLSVDLWKRLECEICFQKVWLHRRVCCGFHACSLCLKQYFQQRVSLGKFEIQCINYNCHSSVNPTEISVRLDDKHKEIYQNLLRSNNDLDKLTRTCPNCNHLYKLKDNFQLHKMRKSRNKDINASKVKCIECKIVWCFLCHAPWHTDITCKQYTSEDCLLREWAKQINQGQLNAQNCPTCKAFIQRSSGCDHMQCRNCKTDFCYKCGEKLRHLKFFGNHYSKLSIFGCKFRYKANQPVLRKTIRFTILCAKLAAAPALGSVALAAIGVAIVVGGAALPVYGLVRGARWIVEKNKLNNCKTFKSNLHKKSNLKNKILIKDLNNQFTSFGINESPIRTATFTQNVNWLANYDILTNLNNSDNSISISNVNSLTSDLSNKLLFKKNVKRRRPQLVLSSVTH